MPSMYTKVGGVWKEIVDPQMNVSGTWKDVNYVWYKTGGVWKKTYTRFSSYSQSGGTVTSDATYYYVDFKVSLTPTGSQASLNGSFTVSDKSLTVDYLLVGQGGNGNSTAVQAPYIYPDEYVNYNMTVYGGCSGGAGGVVSGSTTLNTGTYPVGLLNRANSDLSSSRGGDTTAFGLTAYGGGRGGIHNGTWTYSGYMTGMAGQNGGSGGGGGGSFSNLSSIHTPRLIG